MAKTKKLEEVKVENVLLIDEDQIDNFINERMILSTNFSNSVVVKNSALDALAYLKKLTESKATMPEIIFLDLNMPVMDGFGFLDELAKLPAVLEAIQPKTKIIVLSSSISPLDIDRASANALVYKYFNKPLTEKYLNAINL
ncbi:MAG: response regulator [Pedobacter sp.]|nr:MAG: response regulator [Pedobacter sp.]